MFVNCHQLVEPYRKGDSTSPHPTLHPLPPAVSEEADDLVYLSKQTNHNIVYIRPGWAGYHQSVNFFQSVIRIMIL